MMSASLWVRDPKAFLIWNCGVSKCTAPRESQNTWAVLGPGRTARAWSADPDVWVLGGVTVFPAGLMAGAAGALRNQIKITVVSTSPLLDRAYPSAILMLHGLLLKSWDILSLQEFCGSLLEFLWSVLRVCLPRKKEVGQESRQALGNCDTSILNFCLRWITLSLLGEMCQAIIRVLGWCSFESLCKSLLDRLLDSSAISAQLSSRPSAFVSPCWIVEECC